MPTLLQRAAEFLPAQPREGRPTLCDPAIAKKILENLAAGAYVAPACEAAGVRYNTVRNWLLRAAEDTQNGIEGSVYQEFARSISHAEAAAEQALVQRLNIAEDWRAQAFLLERRHRERWGKTEQQQAPQQVLVISEELAAGMLEALRVAGSARQITDVMSTPDAPQQNDSPNAVTADYEVLPAPEGSEES